MKATGLIGAGIVVAALAIAVWQWREVGKLRRENDALRASAEAHQAQSSEVSDAIQMRETELQKLRSEAQELIRLRGEVTQLRTGVKDADKLRAENQKLRADNQQMRNAAASSTAAPTTPKGTPNTYLREQWTFAGYKTPEDALVSAIWSMHQGNPQQYFESLTPEEQARVRKSWEGKSAEEIVAKHKNDTSAITGIRVLQIDQAVADQQVITVGIDGVNREEKVRMQQINGEWKFGGFIREPQK
jgi:hypothetical protein